MAIEIVTSDEEHPGLLGALVAARELKGVSIERGAVRGGRRTRSARGPGSSPARTSAGSAAASRRRSSRRWRCPCCSTAPRASAPCRSTSPRSAATHTPAPGRSGCADRTGRACCTSAPALRERLQVTRRGYANLADPNAGLDAQPARRRPPPGLAVAERRGARLRAGGDDAAGVGRLGSGARARAHARRAAGGAAGRAGHRRGPARTEHARLLRRAPTPKPSAHGSPPAGWCCATSRDGRGCAPRSGRGTTRATSSGCSGARCHRMSRLARAVVGARRGVALAPRWSGGRAERRQAGPERLRQHLLLGRREVDAALAAQLPVRLLRPGRAGHGRQAAAGAVGAGGEREAVRLLPPQPAAARGDRRRARGGGAVLGDQPPPRPLAARSRARSRWRCSPRSSPSRATTASTRC